MTLDGEIAVVTGGARGIGRAVCVLLAQEGASVVVSDVNIQGAEETVKLLHADSGSQHQHHLAVQTDVSDTKSVDNLASKIAENYTNQVASILVHVAGIVPNLRGTEFESEDLFDKVIGVNLKGTFLVNKKFALMMKEAKIQGSVVNVSSIAKHGVAVAPAYAASKGGVSSLTLSFAKEFAKHGIRFNTVKPGPIDTPFPYTSNVATEDMEAQNAAPCSAPMGRRGTAEEVAQVCLFLASPKSSYVTCSEYEVHGGLHAVIGDTHR